MGRYDPFVERAFIYLLGFGSFACVPLPLLKENGLHRTILLLLYFIGHYYHSLLPFPWRETQTNSNHR